MRLHHTPRPIRPLGLFESDGWRVKLYGIREGAQGPDPAFEAAARRIAQETLPVPAVTPDRYGLAFVTVHQASMFNQIVVDWWERVNELRHRVFKAESGTDFREITASGEAFCVWELAVICHERGAWIRHMLSGPEDAAGYLSDRLDADL